MKFPSFPPSRNRRVLFRARSDSLAAMHTHNALSKVPFLGEVSLVNGPSRTLAQDPSYDGYQSILLKNSVFSQLGEFW